MYIADACVSAGRFAFSGPGKGWCRLAFMVMSSALQISRGPCSLISLLTFLVQYFVVSTVALELENHFWIQFQIQKQHEDFASYPRGQGRARLPYHEGMCHWFGLWDSETFSGTTSHQHVTGYEHVPPGTAGNNTCPISHWFWFTKIIDASILLAQRMALSFEVNNIYKTTAATLKIAPKWRDLQNTCLGDGTRLADWSSWQQILSVSVAERIELSNTTVLKI